MRSAIATMHRAILLASCLGGMLGVLAVRTATAQTIDLSLNVFYNDPANSNSGGIWEVVAKSSDFGISGVSALLTNINTAKHAGPRGTVNGSDAAGFNLFHNTINPQGFRDITIGQVPLPPADIGIGEEQTVFYGVGTLANGAPNYPGQPPGTNSIGPAFSSLSVPATGSGIPWTTGDAFNDPNWEMAARLASGTFSPGFTPSFFSGSGYASSGNVFTTLGSSLSQGTIVEAAMSTMVRTNFSSGVALPDYNNNGVVDAADYLLWHMQLGETGPGLAADGNKDNTVDQADYDLWRTHFGATVPPANSAALASSSTIAPSAVPEPAGLTGLVLLALGALGLSGRRVSGRRAGRSDHEDPMKIG